MATLCHQVTLTGLGSGFVGTEVVVRERDKSKILAHIPADPFLASNKAEDQLSVKSLIFFMLFLRGLWNSGEMSSRQLDTQVWNSVERCWLKIQILKLKMAL